MSVLMVVVVARTPVGVIVVAIGAVYVVHVFLLRSLTLPARRENH